MKRTMVIFTLGFPFGAFEPFIENEYHLYKNYFDKVLIVGACEHGEKPTRQVEDDVIEVIGDETLSKDKRSLLLAFLLVLTDRMFYKEIFSLIKKRRFNLDAMYRLLVVSMCGNHRAWLARKWLKKHPECKVEMVYGYWLSIPAYATLRLAKKIKTENTVARAHGFDLYRERHKGNYIPYQEQICSELKNIATISDNGKKYLEDIYQIDGKISVYKLGAVDKKLSNPEADRKELRIVSCARVVDVKQLDRIVDALALIEDINISWMHIGDGELFDSLQKHAKKLGGNVKVYFTGGVANTRIYEEYATNPFHVFVNVSKSEGLPVAIMESMSFGIPAIATDVGGTSEIVEDGVNGYLLRPDFTDEELAEKIREIAKLPTEEYGKFRINAREKFEWEYNAVENNKRFLDTFAK